MSDESVAESDVVISGSTASLPTSKYQAIVRTLKNQDVKLKAMKNLHQIIQAKDQELKACSEKAQNLQTALDKAEMRLANQIRLSVNGAYQSTLEADSVEQNAASRSEQFVDKSLSQATSSIVQTTDAVEHSSASSSDLEEDSAVEPVLESRRTATVNSQKLLSPPFQRVHLQKSNTPSCDLSFSVTCTGNSTALQNPRVKILPPSFQSVEKAASATRLDSTEKVTLSGGQSLKSVGTTGVSRDLLDKLMQQNARLKKVVRDILHQKGMSFEGYLDQQESLDVITQLREELRLSKAQNEKLKEIFNSRDSEDILKKYSDLSENFLKLKRTATMMQAMADLYSKEYEKLKVENKELKDELSALNQKMRSLELRQQKEVSHGETTSPMTAGADSTVPLRLYETLKVQFEEISTKLSSAETRLQQQSLKERIQQKTVDDLRKQCEDLGTEKELLQSQVTVFQEDFTAEQQKHSEKQQQLETLLAKHQDWIRKLVAEAQKCRSLLEGEKTKREVAVAEKEELEKRFRNFIATSRSMSSCGFEVNLQKKSTTRAFPEDLQVDDGAESASMPSNFQPRCLPSNEAYQPEQSSPLVCPRCEREFEAQDEQKWKDHCARCTDD